MDSLIVCKICPDILKNPVIPCGHTICKKHEKTSNTNCPKCNMVHEIPIQGGFPANILAQNLIKYKFDRLEFPEEQKVAVETNEFLKEKIDEFKRLRDNP